MKLPKFKPGDKIVRTIFHSNFNCDISRGIVYNPTPDQVLIVRFCPSIPHNSVEVEWLFHKDVFNYGRWNSDYFEKVDES
jgi:hypothetical protein